MSRVNVSALKILPYNDDGEICVKNIVYKEFFQKIWFDFSNLIV